MSRWIEIHAKDGIFEVHFMEWTTISQYTTPEIKLIITLSEFSNFIDTENWIIRGKLPY